MKNISTKAVQFFTAKSFFLILFAMATLLFSCDTLELPEEGSLPDETPPAAAFSATPNEADYLMIAFTNLSTSATDYAWDFGDGNTSAAENPTNVYSGAGTYTISLTATDKLNATSTTSQELVIEEPSTAFVPVILNPAFDVQGDDEYRDGWRNSGLGGVIQITSSPTHTGEKAAKLPEDGSRIGYQAISVEEDTDYQVSFYYTLKTSPTGSVSVSILGGEVNDPAAIAGATIASFTGSDQADASTFTQGTIEFNSGSNTTVAIYFTNVGAEGRVDTFEIEVL